MPVFSYHGRPCIVTGEQQRKFRQGRRWVKYVAVFVDYLDDANPKAQAVGQGTFKAAKVLHGAEGDYWKRVADLNKRCNVPLDQARKQALNEVASGRIGGGVVE